MNEAPLFVRLLAWLPALDWMAWLVVAVVVIGLALVVVVLRWLLRRSERYRRARRWVWGGAIAVFGVAVWIAHSLLAGADLGARAPEALAIGAGLVLCLGLGWLADWGLWLFVAQREPNGRGTDMPHILQTGMRIAVYGVAALIAVTLVLEQDTLGFVVSGSVVLGVVGLALQGVLQDAFAGIAIGFEQPFRMGDWIELDDGTIGQVLDLSWRATRVRTFQAGTLVIPNALISAQRVHNHSQNERRTAVQTDVHLPNEINPVMAKRLILEAMLATPEVLSHPTPAVNLLDGSARPYRYVMHFYCPDFPSKYRAISRVYENVWRTLEQEGITTAPAARDAALHRQPPPTVRRERVEDLIGANPLLQALTRDERAELVPSVRYRVFPPESNIIAEGEQGRSLFIVAGGRAQVTVTAEDEAVAELGVGDCFGEMSLLTGAPRSATVRAITECTVLEIDKDAVHAVIRQRPELGDALARVEAQRQLELEAALRDDTEVTEEGIGKRARKILSGMREFFEL